MPRSAYELRRSSSRQADGESVEIRATHEVVAARATKLAFFVDQFMTTAGTPVPVFAGVFGILPGFVGWRDTSFFVTRVHRHAYYSPSPASATNLTTMMD